MSKYKLVGVFNLMFGVIQLLFSAFLIFLIIPRLAQLLSQLTLQTSLMQVYLVLGAQAVFGVGNIFLFTRMFAKKEKVRKYYYSFSALFLFASIVFMIVATPFGYLSVISPIYSLTAN